MGRLTASQVAVESAQARLKIVYGGTVLQARTWDESMQMSVTEVKLEGAGSYYVLTVSDQAGAEEEALLDELEKVICRPLADCVTESERVDQAHPQHPGSSWFELVTLYAN